VKRKAALRIADSPRVAWEGAIRGWFQKTLPDSWKHELPSVVVVPTRGHAHALKARLLQEGQSNLGIHFLTPGGLRDSLCGASDLSLPQHEHLRLLLAIAAEETRSDSPGQEANADNLAAKAVLRAPDHLLRTLNRLETAGWNFDTLQLSSFLPIVRRFRELVRVCGFSLVAQFDRAALAQAPARPPVFSNLLITGFDAAHWHFWFLLRAAVQAAENAMVVLEYPQKNLHGIDTCWIGSWEEALGEAAPVSPPVKIAGDSLFTEAEMQGGAVRPADYSFLVGRDASEQAEAIALSCERFLAEKNCARVGVIFPSAGPLSRLVARALEERDLAHYDGLGHLVPGPFESDEWRAWLELQRSPRISSLVRFFNVLTNAAELFPGLSAPTVEKTLRAIHAELLIDDLEVLRRYCETSSAENGPLIAAAIQSLGSLPPRARLVEFLDQTREVCTRLGWTQHWLAISRQTEEWPAKIPADISRPLFLRWLEEATSSFGLERGPRGEHPYAPVQLLSLPAACGQEWSYLIFAGWNEGSWPPHATGEFMHEDEIRAFNQTTRQLNRRAARTGKQGEGHDSIREGHTFYLGPEDQRRIALRQFDALQESASAGIAIAASLVQESAPERLWNPNELFTRLYQEIRGEPLTQVAMAGLQQATELWLSKQPRRVQSDGSITEVQQTRIAYEARRDPLAEAAEYDFAFRAGPTSVPTLSVSEFEKLLEAPALVWIRKYLGVKAPEDDASVWNTSTGRWIHDWLARIAGDEEKTFVRLPDAVEIDRRVRASAARKRAQVTQLCEKAGKPLPDWWESGHGHALFLARALGEKLATAGEWAWIATEWTIDDATPVRVSEEAMLSVRGRIDLLLARGAPAAGSLAANELWIVDYKTGAKKPLVAGRENADKRRPALRKKLLDGTALQLGLYALAARSLGAGDTWVSILSPLVRPLAPQLSGADIAHEDDIFAALAAMQRTGRFGMHGPLRAAFRYIEDYPLATLAIDPDILEQRWERIHPALVRDEEDIFW
jgi:hypothetical protein